ncbi:MAG TPA: hypothetical protein VLA19_01090 [Herpetosiphonaceae bacterium]|nr:hypothetical protein [Herpetosiphonaceae bacterium]
MAIIELSMVIGAIVEMGVEATWEQILRREAVGKLLTKFGLNPRKPPLDFDSIYAYTLVEYGVSKPEPILSFFRHEFVRDAFYQSFYKNDPSILEKEAEEIVQWNEETGKLGSIDYDPRREFADFTQVFNEVVRRTRTPAEVIQDNKLAAVHSDIQTSAEVIIGHLAKYTASDSPRTNTKQQRLDRLEELDRRSKARCEALWLGAGVPPHLASSLATSTIGVPAPNLQATIQQPLRLLIGDVGAGKSLIAERLFQTALARAHEKISAPVPIIFDAQQVQASLEEVVHQAAVELGDPRNQGATIVIDGLDKLGVGPAERLLREAHVLVRTWSSTTVVITSRPSTNLVADELAAKIPLLSETEAFQLISMFARRIVRQVGEGESWPRSIQDAVRRPLFAVLMGMYLRHEDSIRSPRSTGELLDSLIERSLGQSEADRISTDQLLLRLAVHCIDCGGSIRTADVASRTERQILLASRLVIEERKVLRFALPILAEWFAAQSLAMGRPTPAQLISDSNRLERWRSPLAVFIGTASHDQVSQFLTPIAEYNPGFAAGLVNENLAPWGFDTVSSPPLFESGQQLRTAMQAWVNGLGPLAELIAPVRQDGTLQSLGVRVSERSLVTGWHFGEEDAPNVVELLPGVHITGGVLRHDWPRLQSAGPGRQSAWAWRWTLEELVAALSDRLQQRALPVNEGPLLDEEMWYAARAITDRRSVNPGPISLVEMGNRLAQLSNEHTVYILNGIRVDQARLKRLRLYVKRLSDAGVMELCDPWPTFDPTPSGGSFWEAYTHEHLLTRVAAIYAGACDGYQQLVEHWFPKFSSRLQTAVTFPAELVGIVVPQRKDQPMWVGPTISWYWEPLPRGSNTIVKLRLGERHFDEGPLHTAYERLCMLRPEAASWIGATMRQETLYEYGQKPATKLVYKWLWEDLQRVSWTRGILADPRYE